MLHMYQGIVTAGATDGTLISETSINGGLLIGPLDCYIQQESSPIKLGLRFNPGYYSKGQIIISITGKTASRWSLSMDSLNRPLGFNGYGKSLIINDEIKDTNYIIWAKAQATGKDTPNKDDISVCFLVQYFQRTRLTKGGI